ncbi:NADPH-dependent FMN reductase [Phyllobacterium myrsinacearum]|uniref:NAD(P)H-dependent FMN reductase n=1 Tax=Phyllobacterium myrsinacearum TaxID=28101 RepID=A0A839EDI2_9HYPH|nr:NADPH-dependent FMN reductase [Phyllobacterium myrsinacearum]MBA8876488.1 NAD(P)H-dependent FMN reductase [Phyllobacterium myrsinacearum]
MTKLLALSGSLRAVSMNKTVLEACIKLAPAEVDITLYNGLAGLPPFNPDLDGDNPPKKIVTLRKQIGAADGLVISCPEYAHGIPGSFKNMLDWLVSCVEFPEKPVLLINTSPQSERIIPLLMEVLMTMSARVVSNASLTLPLKGRKLDADGIARNAEFGGQLRDSLASFVDAINAV